VWWNATVTQEANTVELMIEPRTRSIGSGTVRRLLPWSKRRMVGPFIFVDIMGPTTINVDHQLNVDAHPHIGLATMTYLLDGQLTHRDSTGAIQDIEPGAVNWMTAGSGVTHTERTSVEEGAESELFGVQMWVALPRGQEDGAPSFQHCAATEVPTTTHDGVSVRVAAGAGFGEESPVDVSSPLVFAALTLADGHVKIESALPERAIVAMDGSVTIDGATLPRGSLAVLQPGSQPTISGTGSALLFGGEPVGQRHIWWNFVHSDRDVIEAAKQRWVDEGFPLVPNDYEPHVPLPR
jgi:redox-sensitive bicupin YhaK (pirin superfamily)